MDRAHLEPSDWRIGRWQRSKRAGAAGRCLQRWPAGWAKARVRRALVPRCPPGLPFRSRPAPLSRSGGRGPVLGVGGAPRRGWSSSFALTCGEDRTLYRAPQTLLPVAETPTSPPGPEIRARVGSRVERLPDSQEGDARLGKLLLVNDCLGDASRRGGTALLLLAAACSTVGESYESRAAAVLNGEDDRRELFELDDVAERNSLQRSVAALMWAHRIDVRQPGVLRAISAGAALALCDDERFGAQPSASFCSATLIDDDLVVTAGHCLGDDETKAADRCQRLWVAFDYHYAQPNRLAVAVAEDVFACRRVVYHRHDSRPEGFVDVAILQLDRAVGSDRGRATIASRRPLVGDALLAAAHGAGLPLKVDRGGKVTEIPEKGDHLVASTDSFVGGSGAPVFDASSGLVGYQVRGARDWVDDGGCVRVARAAAPTEEHQLVQVAIDALCDSGWPSAALCGKATRCGDQVCSGDESNDDCREDCPTPGCGDAVCELAERASCDTDCRRYLDVPAEWSADPARYRAPKPVAEDDSDLKARGGCAMRAPGAHGTSSVLGALLAWSLLRRRARHRAVATKRDAGS